MARNQLRSGTRSCAGWFPPWDWRRHPLQNIVHSWPSSSDKRTPLASGHRADTRSKLLAGRDVSHLPRHRKQFRFRWIKCSLLLLVASAILPGQFVEGSLLYTASTATTASLIFFDTTALPEQSYHYWVRAETANATSPVSAPDQGFRANGRTSQFDPVPPLAPPRDPIGNPTTGAKIYLGKTLFWEEQLSSTRTVACGTCHRGRSGGSDPRSDVGSSVNPGFDGIFGTDDDVMGSLGVPLNRADGTYEWSPLFGLRPQVTGRKAQSAINAAYSVSSDAGLL